MDYIFSNQIIEELSNRAKLYRISYPLTQSELADKAGVSLRSVQKFESGKDVQMDIFIKIFIALGLGKNFNMLIPDMENRPSTAVARAKGAERKRVRKKKDNNANRTFKWGDEIDE
jgi:transcriptional regulator with XRE-family HTH domain